MIVYVVEDHLVFNQTNYTQYYGGDSVIRNFEHNNVLRKVLTNLFGDPVPSELSLAGSEYVQNFELNVPVSIENTNNIKLVAFVVDAAGNVLNVQSGKIGAFKNYQ